LNFCPRKSESEIPEVLHVWHCLLLVCGHKCGVCCDSGTSTACGGRRAASGRVAGTACTHTGAREMTSGSASWVCRPATCWSSNIYTSVLITSISFTEQIKIHTQMNNICLPYHTVVQGITNDVWMCLLVLNVSIFRLLFLEYSSDLNWNSTYLYVYVQFNVVYCFKIITKLVLTYYVSLRRLLMSWIVCFA